MARRKLTPMRYEEINRLLGINIKVREIARIMKCSRNTVRGIRDGRISDPARIKPIEGPVWSGNIDWDTVIKELRDGHPLKYIWEDRAKELTTYSNFWKQFYRKYPQYRTSGSTHREFDPGSRCEVDYAGAKLEWIDISTGEIHEVPVFIGALGFSQRFFAAVKPSMKSKYFLQCHSEMYSHFGGVPAVTAPDNLKQGVTKCHLYDPDINETYFDLAKHYNTAIVPARRKRPKDKAIAEGAVKLIMRYFRFRYRNHTFFSVSELDKAIKETVEIINNKLHTRFRVSRNEKWESVEKKALKPLPQIPFEYYDYKKARLHPDCHASIESNYYSAPHIHRGKVLKVKIGEKLIEIFFGLQRIAVHKRHCSSDGKYITNPEHLPENSKAYYETTPKSILSQAKYLNFELHNLIDEHFQQDAIGNLRRAQGFIRRAKKEVNEIGFQKAQKSIDFACKRIKTYNRFRVPYFQECLNSYHKLSVPKENRDIKRNPDNPMLRYTKQQKPFLSNPEQGELTWQ